MPATEPHSLTKGKMTSRRYCLQNSLYGNGSLATNVLIAYLAGDPHRQQLEEHLLAVTADYQKPRLQRMISYLAAKAGARI